MKSEGQIHPSLIDLSVLKSPISMHERRQTGKRRAVSLLCDWMDYLIISHALVVGCRDQFLGSV